MLRKDAGKVVCNLSQGPPKCDLDLLQNELSQRILQEERRDVDESKILGDLSSCEAIIRDIRNSITDQPTGVSARLNEPVGLSM